MIPVAAAYFAVLPYVLYTGSLAVHRLCTSTQQYEASYSIRYGTCVPGIQQQLWRPYGTYEVSIDVDTDIDIPGIGQRFFLGL